MSGHKDATICPNCEKNELIRYVDYKPFDQASGFCLNCGFNYETTAGFANLEELNAERYDACVLRHDNEIEYPQLKKLPKQDYDYFGITKQEDDNG